MSDDDLRNAALSMRHVAAKAGSMHGWWDVIFDAEAVLSGRQSLLPRAKVEEMVMQCLEDMDESD